MQVADEGEPAGAWREVAVAFVFVEEAEGQEGEEGEEDGGHCVGVYV